MDNLKSNPTRSTSITVLDTSNFKEYTVRWTFGMIEITESVIKETLKTALYVSGTYPFHGTFFTRESGKQCESGQFSLYEFDERKNTFVLDSSRKFYVTVRVPKELN